MTKTKVKSRIQRLVVLYKATGNEDYANRAYQLYWDEELSDGKKYKCSRKLYDASDYSEFQGLVNITFVRSLEKYDPHAPSAAPFVHFLNRNVNNKMIDVGDRKYRRIYETESNERMGRHADETILDTLATKGKTAEAKVVDDSEVIHHDNYFADETKQVQINIIQEIMDKATETEIRVMELFLQDKTYEQIAEELGFSHKNKGMRIIHKLSKYYDGGQEYKDAFTVPTAVTRGRK